MSRRFYRLTAAGRRALGRELAHAARDLATARARKVSLKD
jgi:hypothetical protein